MVLCGISSRFQLLFPWYGQIAHALLTRPPLTNPKVSSFDLHVLSMPPAFILSQNQTLKFNCLKSLLFQATTALTLLSLCWLAFKVTCVYFKYFEKLTEITFLFALCQIKSHFFLIPFLIYFSQATAWCLADLSATACIIYHIYNYFVKQKIQLFLKKFLNVIFFHFSFYFNDFFTFL